MLRRAVAVGFALLLFTGSLRADDRLDVKVLYCGDLASERTKDFGTFLESHFSGGVVLQDLFTFQEEQARDCDLVIFDWSSTIDSKGEVDEATWMALKKAPSLNAGFNRPAILIGAAGVLVARDLKLKIHLGCRCLDDSAHHLASDHPLFRTPLEVNLELAEMPTPEGYQDLTIDSSLGATMQVWQVQTKNPPDVDQGVVSSLYGFADSPDAEVFAHGIAMKGPDSLALGRHANYFLWGFSAPPSAMTPAARRLFVNTVAYMRKFDGQSPLVRRTSTAREWAIRYGMAPRTFNEETRRRTERTLREALPQVLSLLPSEVRDNPEAYIAKQMAMHKASELVYLQQVIPKPLYDEFGLDSDKYVAYYRENLEYLWPDPDDAEKFAVDDDAKTVGPSNRRPEMLERCVAMLQSNDRPELATRLLKRYTSEDIATAAQWRTWLDANKSRLFFSDVGGYKFFVGPESP
jgi:hypothetical protein